MMSRRFGAPAPSSRGWGRRSHLRLSFMLVCLLAVTIASLVLAAAAGADARPPGGNVTNPVVREVDIAQPAIVRIASVYHAHLSLTVCGQRVTLPTTGNGYLTGGVGSGTFISSNGDILTADHVVHIPEDVLTQQIVQDAAPDIADAVNAACRPQQPVTPTEIAAGFLDFAGIPYSAQFSEPDRIVWQSTTFTGPTTTTTRDSLIQALLAVPHQSAAILQFSPFTQNDLAIVHVDLTDTPSVQLDTSTSVAIEDPLTIIGYPGNGDVSNDATNLLTPSVNNIVVSAIKNGSNGEKLIQVGGNVEHGDSGGPALDSAGHIVGVVSFGGDDPRGITAFLRSSTDALSLMTQAHITTTPGQFQTLWRQAFLDYSATYAGHWHRSAQEFDSLSTQYPKFNGITPYKTYADTAALTERVPTSEFSVVAVGSAALALVLAVVLGATLLMVRHRRRVRQATFAPASQVLYAPYPYAQNGYGSYGPPSTSLGPQQMYGGYGPPSNYLPQPGYPSTSGPQAVGVSAWSYTTPGHPAETEAMGQMPPLTPGMGTTVPPYASGLENIAGMNGASISVTGYCLNGHPLSTGEIYCARCGAPRAQYSPSAQ